MGAYQRAIAVMLVACLVSLPYGRAASSPQGGPPQKPTRAKQRVELFGVGTDVIVKLASGDTLRGSIGAIEELGFDLISDRERTPRRITYDQVSEVKLANPTYRASAAPNSEEVRRVVVSHGVDKHMKGKLSSGEEFRGRIRAISDDNFVLHDSDAGRSFEIAYGDVQLIGPSGREKNSTIIWTLVGVTVLIGGGIAYYLYGRGRW